MAKIAEVTSELKIRLIWVFWLSLFGFFAGLTAFVFYLNYLGSGIDSLESALYVIRTVINDPQYVAYFDELKAFIASGILLFLLPFLFLSRR